MQLNDFICKIQQVPLASALQGLHTHTTQAALAVTLPQQTQALVQAQAQQTQAVLNNTIAGNLATATAAAAAVAAANGAYGNSTQLVCNPWNVCF